MCFWDQISVCSSAVFMNHLIFVVSLISLGVSWDSEVTTLWPTIIEVVNITKSHGGPEDDSFSQTIADEAIRKWKKYASETKLSEDEMNDGFYHYQRAYFDRHRKEMAAQGFSDSLLTWLELQSLPEYQRLRHYIEKFGKRYLQRLGYNFTTKFNIFSWAAVHADADFHGPHTHTGELLVGVYYARTTPSSGRLRLFDPRGQIPPFGKHYDFSCMEGQMIFFPSWLQHSALTTKLPLGLDKDSNQRVIFAFNIGIASGRGDILSLDWHLDPTSGFMAKSVFEIAPEVVVRGDCDLDSAAAERCSVPKRIEL